MVKVIACVPNFSEGRESDVCRAIAATIEHVKGITLLDLHMDGSHNRSVMTFVGSDGALVDAAFGGAKEAMKHIDLNRHTGEHPRMGATDVIPFIPIQDSTIDECDRIANTVAGRIGNELQIPVFMYECSAKRPDRKILSNIRKGEFEGLRDDIGKDPNRAPDYGPSRIHPTAGAVAVGARMPLIAYNVDLKTTDLKIAKKIAKEIRESSGGLPAVRALGMWISERNCAQVSMNLVNYTVTNMDKVYGEIEKRATEAGVNIRSSEVVGMLPRVAINKEWVVALKMESFDPMQIIENRLGI